MKDQKTFSDEVGASRRLARQDPDRSDSVERFILQHDRAGGGRATRAGTSAQSSAGPTVVSTTAMVASPIDSAPPAAAGASKSLAD